MKPEELNRAGIQLVPELDSEWTRAPISYSRWRNPDETLDNGDPCFIPSPQDLGPRKDYIYMPVRKDLEAGYYHLRTQEAHVQVYYRLQKKAPPLCCGKSTVSRKEFRQVKRLVYNRVISEQPDDVQAARMALLQSTSSGGKAASFGKALYLPTFVTVFFLQLGIS